MIKLLQNWRKRRGKSVTTVKKNNRAILKGSIIATFIASTPYLFYLYESVPEGQIWNTFLFDFDAKSWEDVQYMSWVVMQKVIPLSLLFVWFFTCRHWWYHALLVPMTMYIYQLIGIFDDNIGYYDTLQLIYLVPLMAVIIPSIYLVRARMFDNLNNANKTLEELEEEFKFKPKSVFQKLGDYF